uniref:Uncharacterized protein n=1 Tax=Timema bartmani TaxID=61472 RepID=A0A7R9F016_9NEOP|nr:unnamed protein product [Timema bartmani]
MVELYKTGGGTFTKQLDDEGAKLMALLKPQFVPLVNLSDSDAGYHIELPGEEKVEKVYEDLLTVVDHLLLFHYDDSKEHQLEDTFLQVYEDLLMVVDHLLLFHYDDSKEHQLEDTFLQSRTGIAITSGGLRRTRSIPPTLVLLPLALSRASIKPILWDDGLEGERRGMASQPTKVFLHANKNRWITETVDGARYRTGLAEKLYV